MLLQKVGNGPCSTKRFPGYMRKDISEINPVISQTNISLVKKSAGTNLSNTYQLQTSNEKRNALLSNQKAWAEWIWLIKAAAIIDKLKIMLTYLIYTIKRSKINVYIIEFIFK